MKSFLVLCVLFGTFMTTSARNLKDVIKDFPEEPTTIQRESPSGNNSTGSARTTIPYRGSFGDDCSEWSKCATQSWLSCRNGRCECFKPEEMEFHSNQRKCVARAGERCKYIAGELDGRSLFDSVGCVENAVCSVDGVCTCGVGLYKTTEGHCAPLKDHEDKCVAHLECSKERGIWCSNGTCACNSNQGLISDPDKKECIALAKKKCRRNGGEFACVDNASCNSTDFCECSRDFYATSDGTCSPLKYYGGQCDEDAGCSTHHNLGCFDGICGCDANQTMEIDVFSKQHFCVGQADRPCLGYGNSCTELAVCLSGICRCIPYHYRNSHGQCERTVGRLSPCTQNIQCSHGLKCIEGQCQCDPEVAVFATVRRAIRPIIFVSSFGSFEGYEKESHTECVGLSDRPCRSGLCAPDSYCNYSRQQSPPSDGWSFGSAIAGVCQCEPGLSLSKSKTCVPGYNQSCSSDRPCMEGLYCKNNNVCSCELDPHSEYYNSTSQTCYSIVGGPCESNDNCGKNAHCGGGFCKCSSGFVTSPTRECEATAGKSCNSKDDCDSIAGLNCVNNSCKCPNFGMYDAWLRKCVGLVGGRCVSNQDCIQHATCFKDHSQLPGLCKCISGFPLYPDYTCG